jgi:hypothetical protein
MNREDRGPWYLITAIILGVSAGLFYSWVVSSVEYIDTAPASLRTDHKDSYRALVAAAFAANGDLPRARARLALLGDEDVQGQVALQAQQYLETDASSVEGQSLILLAQALERGLSTTPVIQIPPTQRNTPTLLPATPVPPTPSPQDDTPDASPTPSAESGPPRASPTVTLTPTIRAVAPTVPPLPTRTPTPTQGAPFVLKKEAAFACTPPRSAPLIIVEALDAAGKPIPGVQVLVSWPGGEDRFYTGLKPELGLGYADFTMQPGVVYTVQLAPGGQPVTGLSASECESRSQERFWGAWRLIFTQP